MKIPASFVLDLLSTVLELEDITSLWADATTLTSLIDACRTIVSAMRGLVRFPLPDGLKIRRVGPRVFTAALLMIPR